MDLLRWPVVGTLARRRHARLLLQLPMLAVAIVVVWHGLSGPQLAPRNLATVLSWVHYRGLLVIALLAVGNLFCTGCPMILARDAGRRLAHPAWRWPRALRNKWPALLLFAAVLFAYELFDLWSLPRATAWLVLAYFGAALVVDVLFAGASFCKYVCPIGQFNFLSSMMSPTELRVRDMATCHSCRTVDCLKGRRERVTALATTGTTITKRLGTTDHDPVTLSRIVQRGCELHLFLPAKVGNLDCTLCLDCVHACPHDNIALATRVPGDEIIATGRRSGIGRLSRRADFAALAVVFTFGALLNAFAMTAPASRLQGRIAEVTGVQGDAMSLGVIVVGLLAVLPALLLGTAALVTRLLARPTESLRDIVLAHAFVLVPLGLGMWVAHYLFHLLTGAWTIVPVTQSAIVDLAGRPLLGEPLWAWLGARQGTVFPVQLGALLLGATGSIATAFRVSTPCTRAALPWTVVILGLAAWGAWILSLPMDMRAVGMSG